MKLIHEQKFFIHTYEIDTHGRAQVLALLNFLQDAAAGHASKLGFGVPDLAKRGLTWVLSRYHVSLQRYPRFFDEVTVTTWPSGLHGYFALRDFEMSDAKGPFLAATTSWMLLSLQTKQPVKAEDHLSADMVHPRRSLPDAFPTLPSLAGAVREMKFRVARRDLDMNKHVNNVVYIHWALEAVEDEVAGAKRPVDLEVSYRAEAFYKEDIISSVGPAEEADRTEVFLHRIVRASDGTELARLRSRWA